MATSRLPLDIKTFLIESIDSIAHLEVLLMLYNNKDREWDAESVSKELRSNHHSAENQLSQLTNKGFFKVNDFKKYKYGPSSDEVNQKIARLHDIYNEMPVAVVTCIYDKPKDILKDLSDAFRLKKD